MISPALEGVSLRYPKSHIPAIREVSLRVDAGEIFCILGPSGSGKTTILKLMAGLLRPQSGRVLFDDTEVSHLPPESRDAVMVFQNPLLFPFMNVGENVAFGLRMAKMAETERTTRVEQTLEYVHLAGFANRRVNQLSGGQRQRIALARALALRPGLLLLDEPLSNLDEHLRDEMRELILSTRDNFDTTVVIVTHDRHDAATLSDRMAVVLDGEVRQVGRFDQLLCTPTSRKAAEFLGNHNWITGTKRGGEVITAIGTLSIDRLVRSNGAIPDGPVLFSVRPEELRLGSQGPQRLSGEVVRGVDYGSHSRCRVRLGEVYLDVTVPAGQPLPVGRVDLSFNPQSAIVLPG